MIEGFTKVFYPEASSTVVFVIMVVIVVLLIWHPSKPVRQRNKGPHHHELKRITQWEHYCICCWAWLLLGAYPVFMKYCFALFALCIQPAAGLPGFSFAACCFEWHRRAVAGHAMKV